MSNWPAFLLQIIVAQALGVGLAWGVDAASWKNRATETDAARQRFLSVLFFITPAIVLFCFYIPARGLIFTCVFIVLWLLIITLVQKKQNCASFFIVFVRAFNHFVFFAMFLILVNMALTEIWDSAKIVFVITYLVSAILTYALLSLFRPTIYATCNAFRQFAGKNRPMR